VGRNVHDDFISQPHVMEFLEAESVRLLVFDPQNEEVVEWIDWNNTEPSSSKS
jgi:hypothetical protein